MKEQQLALREEPSIGLMLQTFIEKGVTAENVAALGQLMALKERMDEKQAQREFASAFVALQGEMPVVKATKAVMNSQQKGGGVRYKFAPYEDIMKQAQPFLQKHKFTVTFDNKIDDTRVVAVCTLMHASGHLKENSFACRIGSGPPGSNESQADGSASSYAKRFALCNALNIIVEHIDDDARLLGGPITAEFANALKDRVEYMRLDKTVLDSLFKLAGVADGQYEAIPESKYDVIDQLLLEKEIAAKVRNKAGEWL